MHDDKRHVATPVDVPAAVAISDERDLQFSKVLRSAP